MHCQECGLDLCKLRIVVGILEAFSRSIKMASFGYSLAAVVGSQAIITFTFSIIKQCSALGCLWYV